MGKYPVGVRPLETCNRCHKNAGNHKLSAGKDASGANGAQRKCSQHKTPERMQSQQVVPVFVNSFFLYILFSEEVLRHGNSVEILVIKKQLCDRLNELISAKFQGEPEENDVIYFSANQDEVLKALENLGQIKTSNAFPTMCTVADDMKNPTKGKRSKFTVLTR